MRSELVRRCICCRHATETGQRHFLRACAPLQPEGGRCHPFDHGCCRPKSAAARVLLPIRAFKKRWRPKRTIRLPNPRTKIMTAISEMPRGLVSEASSWRDLHFTSSKPYALGPRRACLVRYMFAGILQVIATPRPGDGCSAGPGQSLSYGFRGCRRCVVSGRASHVSAGASEAGQGAACSRR